ncbi:melatonin receptor type 1B-A-like [Lingula anatina]|uniref:Melatonin receptor type 1B-A-like n=1 Tax=Lingula anatina TaxID=7574 RepID=A0A1S3H7M5_LINAN|nr:melatonin receptor type 1B-A-like [Lingula anatina]|eukprot:XP_013382008.1 melatonin receptor type 1B-A-like [Lingula anatina]
MASTVEDLVSQGNFSETYWTEFVNTYNGTLNATLNTTSNSKTHLLPTQGIAITAAIIMVVFTIGGLAGNLWIMAVLCYNRKLLNAINVFIVSLCVNDVMNIGICEPTVIQTYFTVQWLAEYHWCTILPLLAILFTGCSLWHSAFIAIHRYLVVVKTTVYNGMNQKMYIVMVLILARIIPACCLIPLILSPSSKFIPKLIRCVVSPKYTSLTVIVILNMIAIPCAIVVVCFGLIFIHVRRVARRVRSAHATSQREIQITKMFGVIFLVFIIGYMIYGLVKLGDRHNTVSGDVYILISLLHHIGTCITPLIYGAMNQQIRELCLRTLYRERFKTNAADERLNLDSRLLMTRNISPSPPKIEKEKMPLQENAQAEIASKNSLATTKPPCPEGALTPRSPMAPTDSVDFNRNADSITVI